MSSSLTSSLASSSSPPSNAGSEVPQSSVDSSSKIHIGRPNRKDLIISSLPQKVQPFVQIGNFLSNKHETTSTAAALKQTCSMRFMPAKQQRKQQKEEIISSSSGTASPTSSPRCTNTNTNTSTKYGQKKLGRRYENGTSKSANNLGFGKSNNLLPKNGFEDRPYESSRDALDDLNNFPTVSLEHLKSSNEEIARKMRMKRKSAMTSETEESDRIGSSLLASNSEDFHSDTGSQYDDSSDLTDRNRKDKSNEDQIISNSQMPKEEPDTPGSSILISTNDRMISYGNVI